MYDSKFNYGYVSKTLHWLVGISIIGLLIAGFYMTNIEDSDLKWKIYEIHKASGITLIFFALLRIIWRIYQKPLALPVNYQNWQKIAAHSVHGVLYLLSLLMPISGWIMSMAANHIPSWFGLFELRLPISQSKPVAKIASQAHEVFAWIIIGLLVLHLAAALVNKDVLKRMLPVCKKN